MIDQQLAQKFIDKIASYTSHNVNIMNEQGIIIAASKDPLRVGTFHETAYEMLRQGSDVLSVPRAGSYLGVQPGVNMTLTCQNKKIGVVGVTGVPEEIYDIALIIKMSLETMMEYEMQHEQIQMRKNASVQFVNALLYSQDKDTLRRLPSLARELGFQENLLRIPILVTSKEASAPEDLQQVLRSSSLHHPQDILLTTRDNHLLIYKYFEEPLEDLFPHYQESVEEYLNALSYPNLLRHFEPRFFVGTFQTEMEQYRHAFQHCAWLDQNVSVPSGEICFFYHHLREYLTSQVPFIQLHHIYQPFSPILEENFRKTLVDTVDNLERHNYNFNTTSRDQFIHKNTLVFRFNKIRNFFGLNPIHQTADRNFLDYLTYYLKQI